jgi:hypothetical protein
MIWRLKSITAKIPEPVKREVRQTAGFGCCKCGLLIIEYHHIVKDSTNPNEIMLLCPIHHHEATVGAMLEEEQWNYKKNRYNIENGFVQGQLKVNQTTPVVNIGNSQFIGTGDFLVVDGENLLSLQINEGKLEVSIKLYDQNDVLVADIQNNEWISGNPLPWDIEASFQLLKIRRKHRDFEFFLDARAEPIDIRADMYRKKQNFQLRSNEIFFNGVKTHITLSNFCYVALRLEADTTNDSFSIAPDSRFGKGIFVSYPNTKERIRRGLLAWKELSCEHEFDTIVKKVKYTVLKCNKCGKISKLWN